jgi:serine/threonine-protein kinase HipA
MTLHVFWDGAPVGVLDRIDERSRDYTFRYTRPSRPVSLSLPIREEPFTPAESRPFFEALLPEGGVREQVAAQLKLAASDSYGLLAALGADCAGAIQIMEERRLSEPPSVRWLDEEELDTLIADLPRRPLGLSAADERMRLSLAGVQRKAVLVRDPGGRFGEPLSGMPTTDILKPDPPDGDYRAIAVNEFFCMSLAARCDLVTAPVELRRYAGRPCLVVKRYDRDYDTWPVTRLHQEDLCQALGITPDFKYQRPGWRQPSYEGLGRLLDTYGLQPGLDRLAAADAAVFNFLVGNADAHAKNISLLHQRGGLRLAPLYDLVSTTVYDDLNADLALGIGDVFDPDDVGNLAWDDFAADLGLQETAFRRRRVQLAATVAGQAAVLCTEARVQGWHDVVLDRIVAIIHARTSQLS